MQLRRVDALQAQADGSLNQWTASPVGTAAWEAVSDEDEATAINAPNVGLRQSFDVEPLPVMLRAPELPPLMPTHVSPVDCTVAPAETFAAAPLPQPTSREPVPSRVFAPATLKVPEYNNTLFSWAVAPFSIFKASTFAGPDT